MSFVGGIATISDLDNISEALPPTILFLLVGIILSVFRGKTPEEKEEMKRREERYQMESDRKMTADHITGLPVPDGMSCGLEFMGDALNIRSCGNLIHLSCDRMIGAVLKTNVEIQIEHTSNAGGAMAGALEFGWLGALLFGGVKKIETEISSYFLIVTYISDHDQKKPEYLVFRVEEDQKALRFADLLQKNCRHPGATIVL